MAYNHALIVARVRNRLSQRPRIPLTQLARELKIDRHTIDRALIATCGHSYRHVQQQYLAVRALLLLNESNLSAKQIAAELGYEVPESLTRFLRKATGRTPKQFRQIR